MVTVNSHGLNREPEAFSELLLLLSELVLLGFGRERPRYGAFTRAKNRCDSGRNN